jgi:hypothetical protein
MGRATHPRQCPPLRAPGKTLQNWWCIYATDISVHNEATGDVNGLSGHI